AVQGVMASKFRNAGQTCICANRIYVQSGAYDDFVSAVRQAVSHLKVGEGLDEATDLGPLVNEAGLEKVSAHVDDALRKGASLVYCATRLAINTGNDYAPTILPDAASSMVIMNEGTFGPVDAVQKIETGQEAIQLANESPYGLAAYVFTEKVARGMRLIEQLDYGIVGWNDGAPSAAQVPFGGMKESGINREGGREGIEAFLETQYVSVGIE